MTGKFRTHSARWMTWPEWKRRAHRREKILNIAFSIAALILPSLIAWSVMAAVVGSP